ncbi:acyltransferase family protein [Salmonirosea aquatica]|uniref:Acyltransferase family protein n=1 Tax=Salmonirosea aquatica TaxID=2654236 RepID=A0A7C9FD15_9BACT|nr:acyltransferase family protein [Cytophagaceae bacterium SJW1-29]
MHSKKILPNLNGIRSIAALMVLFHHIEQAKEALGIPNIYHLDLIKHIGRLGVGLFFVLSGFLITYLLLQEKGHYGNIDTRRFYLRRVFRIWPTYFLIVGLSYFVLPYLSLFAYPGANENVFTHYGARLFFLLLVLPNYAFVLYDLPYWCAQAWSIGVEEQFYYLWPWLIKYPRNWIIILVVFLLLTSGLLAISILWLSPAQAEPLTIIGTFLGQFRIQIMAVGGFCAYLAFNDIRPILDVLYRKELQIGVYVSTALLLLSGIHFPGFMEIYSLLFGYIILNLATNPKSIINIRGWFMNYSGKISYGLYLYHVVVMVGVLNVLENFRTSLNQWAYNGLLYVSVVVLSIGVAAASYEYLERPLLRYKDERFGR